MNRRSRRCGGALARAGWALASVLLLVSPAMAQGERRGSYLITGDDFTLSRQAGVRISTLTNARLESDSLVITAERAERREAEALGTDELFLEGSVEAIEGTTRIRGERGHYDRGRNTATVAGAVTIDDGDTQIACEEAVYDRGAQLIHLRGAVDVRQPKSRLRAERVDYNRLTRHAEAFEGVVLEDLEQETVLHGEHGSYDRLRDEALMDAAPQLLSISAGDTVRVYAREMRQRRADSLAIAVGNVRYLRGPTEAVCDSALFYQAEDRLLLFGQPRVLRKGSALAGDTLELFFRDGEVQRMNIDGNASFRDRPADARVFPGRQSEIRGERFRVRFREGEIDEVEVQGTPRSTYIPPLGEDGRASINEAAGDSMLLRFAGGELDEVRIFGQATGAYRYLDDWSVHLARPDSAGVDSLPGAAAAGDSAACAARFAAQAQTIEYRANSILYEALLDRAYLEGEAEVGSADFTLQARAIRFDAGDDFLDARGEPVLVDAGDKLYGSLMEYAIDERVGLVHSGTTRYGEGFYTGERLKKNPDERVHAYACTYTTCDLAEPHFHFKVDRMTIQTKDKIVGAPVRFYLGDVPLFYLPFLFNDLKRGRRSGFLQPDFEFGITLSEEKPQRFIRDLGYYFATNEYSDFTVRGSFEERRSLFGSFSGRYYQRYFLDGTVNSNLSYDLRRNLVNDTIAWGLHGNHNQEIGERTKLNADIDFVSSEELRDIDNYTVEETVNQRLTSNVGLSRKWDNLSLNGSYKRTQILNQEDDDPDTNNLLLEESTPLSFSATPLPLLPGLRGRDGLRGALAGLKLTPRLSYTRSSRSFETKRVVTESASTGSSLGLNFKLGLLTVRPGFSASENWARSNQPVAAAGLAPFGKGAILPPGVTPLTPTGESAPLATITTSQIADGEFSHRWSASTAVSMKLFGLFYPRLGRLTGVRHTVAPAASWSYAESRGKSFGLGRSINLSLDNTLDLKLGEGDKVERKPGVLNWNLATGYDLTKKSDERPWSALSSSVQFNPLPAFNLALRQSYDINEGEKLSTTLSGSLSLSGAFRYGEVERSEQQRNLVLEREGSTPAPPAQPPPDAFDPNAPLREGESSGAEPAEGGSAGPPGGQRWNLSTSFTLNRTPSSAPSPTINLGGRLDLTENWSFDYRTSVNLSDGVLGTQSIHLTRDLHCWEASFSRLVFQGREQYYFRIYLRAHPEDIKIESGDRGAGFGGF